MKIISLTKVILFSVSVAALLTSVVQAEPPARHKKKDTILDQNNEERWVMVTGSNMPQKVTVRSIGTTTPYNVRIYTKRELDSTGRQTLAGALSVLDPSIQISGH